MWEKDMTPYYEHNGITIYNGDCREILPTLDKVDLVLTDPPYGTTACKWDSVIPLEPMWVHLKRVIKPNGAIVMTASQPFTTTLISSNIKEFKYDWVWEKNKGSNFGAVRYQPMKEHESILVFSKGRHNYYPIKQARSEAGKAMVASGVVSKGARDSDSTSGWHNGYDNSFCDPELRVPRSIQKFNVNRGLHPTQKPVALMEYLIKTYTHEVETVLDFTMGSGTTGIACHNTGRDFIGIEMDNDYFKVAKERIEKAQTETICTT